MTKTICDICGKDMPTETHTIGDFKIIKLGISSYGKMWDICNECRKELNKWMKKRKAESEAESEG